MLKLQLVNRNQPRPTTTTTSRPAACYLQEQSVVYLRDARVQQQQQQAAAVESSARGSPGSCSLGWPPPAANCLQMLRTLRKG